MYVCSCNAITDRQVRSVAHESGGCVRRAYDALGHRPQCGKCLDHVRTMLHGHACSSRAPLPFAAD